MSGRIAICLLLCMFSVAFAQTPESLVRVQTLTQIVPGIPVQDQSFMILVDDKTFDHCKSQIMEYKRAIEREGLPTFVLAANWINPQDIRLKLQEFHRNQHLEGVLLLGNIPDVHLTFGKNKLQSFLSDRFYDTFDVELTFLGTQPGATSGRPIPIYTIPDSAPTRFRSTLYSARLRLDETLEEEVAFGQLSAFLEKAAQAHVEAISLRNLLYVHQAPSALNPSARAKDMELWLAQTERLEEQFRSSIDDRVRIRFVHADRLMESSNIPFEDPLKFPQLDLAFVHGHLFPNEGGADELQVCPTSALVLIHSGGEILETTWKKALFAGSTLVVKSQGRANDPPFRSSYLSGLLGLGARVGQWVQHHQTWHSSLSGDPTFRFDARPELQKQIAQLLSGNTSISTLQEFVRADQMPDAQCIALSEIYRRNLPDLSSLLKWTFTESKFAVVRCTAFHLLQAYDRNAYQQILGLAKMDHDAIIRQNAQAQTKP